MIDISFKKFCRPYNSILGFVFLMFLCFLPFYSYAESIILYDRQTNANQGLVINSLTVGGLYATTTAEEISGYNFFKYPTTTMTELTHENTTICYEFASTSRAWVLEYFTGSVSSPKLTYKNSSGTTRTLARNMTRYITINGRTYSFSDSLSFKEAGYGADSSCVKAIKYNLSSASYVGFVNITSEDLSYINTEEEVVEYIDQLNDVTTAGLNSSSLDFGYYSIEDYKYAHMMYPVSETTYSSSSTIEFNFRAFVGENQSDFNYLAFSLYNRDTNTYKLGGFIPVSVGANFDLKKTITDLDDGFYNVKVWFTKGISDEYSASQSFWFILNDSFYTSEDYPIGMFGEIWQSVKNKFPLGFITDFVAIVGTTTATDLPVLTFRIPTANNLGSGHVLILDPNHKLDWVLNSTSTIFAGSVSDSDMTFYELTSPYWNTIVYLMAFIYMLYRIFPFLNEFRGEVPSYSGRIKNKRFIPVFGEKARRIRLSRDLKEEQIRKMFED